MKLTLIKLNISFFTIIGIILLSSYFIDGTPLFSMIKFFGYLYLFITLPIYFILFYLYSKKQSEEAKITNKSKQVKNLGWHEYIAKNNENDEVDRKSEI